MSKIVLKELYAIFGPAENVNLGSGVLQTAQLSIMEVLAPLVLIATWFRCTLIRMPNLGVPYDGIASMFKVKIRKFMPHFFVLQKFLILRLLN
jgi:hypothetical protein